MAEGPFFLVLEARFLAGTYGGVEWPPSPFRLLQAMVAGCRSVALPGIQWLEQQPAPLILATDEPQPTQVQRSVPNNADPRKPQARLTLRQVNQRHVEQAVRFCYPLRSSSDHAAAAQVLQEARQTHTLGVGQDMCSLDGRVVQAAPESLGALHLWMPSLAATVRTDDAVALRIPVAGSLIALEDRFQAFQTRLQHGEAGFGRPVLPAALHATAHYRHSSSVARTALIAMQLVQPDNAQTMARFHAADAVVVAGMLRHGTMQLAAAHAPALTDFAAGYGPNTDKDRRMSWVPIPSVGNRHADGMLRRALLLARAQDAGELSQLLSCLSTDGLPLVDEHTGEQVARALPVDLTEQPMLRFYLAPATQWTSITPVILPGDYGAGDLRLMHKLLCKALREAGIDPGLLEHAEFGQHGFAPQAVDVKAVRLKNWQAKKLILYHVKMRFHHPLRGPVVLGRGRHYGLGLCAANL